MKKSRFAVSGMTCTACVGTIEKNVNKLDGVKNVDVNLLTGNMIVTYDEALTGENRITEAVAAAGYTATPFVYEGFEEKKKSTKVHFIDRERDPSRVVLAKLIASACILVILIYLSLAHRFSFPLPSFFTSDYGMVNLAFTEFLLTIPIILFNQHYFTNGFAALLRRAPNMNTLIATGATAALSYSIYLIYAIISSIGNNHQSIANEYCAELYFESCALILTSVTIGKFIESYSKGKTSEAVTKFVNLAPKTATVLRDGREYDIPVNQLTIDDTVIVKAGQVVPADGVIIEGCAAIDESAITGEVIPVDKTVDDTVAAATVNRTGYIKFKVKKVGQDTVVANIIRIVEDAATTKTPISKLADKVSGVFVPIVMAIALISLIVWSVLGYPFGFAISTAISVLVISCPCALSLATPTSIMVGMGLGAQNGIIIKSAEPLQAAKKIDIVALDKTGIITEGHPRVTDVFPIAPLTEIQLAAIAAAMENMSEHPYARAIVDFAHEQGIKILNADDFHALSGLGIEASMFGRKLYAGSLNFMQQNHIKLFGYDIKGAALSEKGKTPLYFSDDKKLLGMIAVEDTIKESSFVAIDEFEKMGIEVIILTGDNKRTTKAIAKQLGINNSISEILPDEKEQEIMNLQAGGKKVAMIGDGINDARALVAADIGIAIGAGMDIAVESADIILLKNDLTDAVAAVQLCHAVFRNIKQNLFWAFFYNILMLPIAAGALYTTLHLTFSPSFAAIVMSISSICVILNALRLKRYKSKFFRSAAVEEEKPEQLTIKVARDTQTQTPAASVKAAAENSNMADNVSDNDTETVENEEKTAQTVDPKDMAISNIGPALECMPEYTTQIPIITQEMLEGKYDFSKMPYTIKKPHDIAPADTAEQNSENDIKQVSHNENGISSDGGDNETVEFEEISSYSVKPQEQDIPETEADEDAEDNEGFDELSKTEETEYTEETDVGEENGEPEEQAEQPHKLDEAREGDTEDLTEYDDTEYIEDDTIKNSFSKLIMLGGLKDEASARRAEQALNSLKGVNAIVDFDSGNARVMMDIDYTDETLINIIENEGLLVLSIDSI